MPNLRFLNMSANGMAFDPETGESYQMNGSAQFILQSLQKGLDSQEIASALSLKFNIPFEKAHTDVLEFQVQLEMMAKAA